MSTFRFLSKGIKNYFLLSISMILRMYFFLCFYIPINVSMVCAICAFTFRKIFCVCIDFLSCFQCPSISECIFFLRQLLFLLVALYITLLCRHVLFYCDSVEYLWRMFDAGRFFFVFCFFKINIFFTFLFSCSLKHMIFLILLSPFTLFLCVCECRRKSTNFRTVS